MYTKRNFNFFNLLKATKTPILLLTIWSLTVVLLYTLLDLKWLKVPWQPLTIVGTAVAFYVGFKNNSAYSRTWEARKIWGAMVNSSRTWGIMVKDFITHDFLPTAEHDKPDLKEVKQLLVYRHIAWLYQLKRQLRLLKPWEHNKRTNENYRALIKKEFPEEAQETELKRYISNEDYAALEGKKNWATQLIAQQSETLKTLRSKHLIDDFRHMELQRLLSDFYVQQGKAERIKNFPLPRQYATVSFYFIIIFIFLMPLGLLSAFDNLAEISIWGIVPFTILIGWIFWLMEMVGDYAENPFEHLIFDIPMTNLTRTIEIDLKEMLNETDIPEAITPKQNFLM